MQVSSNKLKWIYLLLISLWLGIIAWLWQEQRQQFIQDIESLRAQGRLLIQTIADSIRSQSRIAMYHRGRMQAIIDEVALNPGVLAIALFDGKGDTVAAAGELHRLANDPEKNSLENNNRDSLQLWSPVRIGAIPPPYRALSNEENCSVCGKNKKHQHAHRHRRLKWWRKYHRHAHRQIPPESRFLLTVLLPRKSLTKAAGTAMRLRFLVGTLSLLLLLTVALVLRSSMHWVALRSSLTLAEEQNRYLKEMNLAACGLAHETKNPLNTVRMAAQTLVNVDPGSKDWQERTSLIAAEVDRLDARINEWLAFSKPRKPKLERVNLQTMFVELKTLVALDAEEKHIALEANCPAIQVKADREMLRQLLFNLLINGIQALTAHGLLKLEAKINSSLVKIIVADNGCGVITENRHQLFTPYFTTRHSGSGLGLAICRRIVIAHGWHLYYEPRLPQGSQFIIDGICQEQFNA